MRIKTCRVMPAGETVAVKSVDASNFRSIAQIDQIQDEISVLSGLKHPCIIRLLDMHFTNNIFYFVMEYASGGCLVDYVRKQVGGPCPLLLTAHSPTNTRIVACVTDTTLYSVSEVCFSVFARTGSASAFFPGLG